ncbi:O-succinylhomoserine sulfhydrylase [Halomonas faecis]|uniref:O-succinylhomoserine sulfhydrylase n=1 Tax=Halomonas faecis TaxID=1562110 RepID=UPI0013D08168|nr:O-succinylhomoserine sulfhydrylase [Halomonas faecis]
MDDDKKGDKKSAKTLHHNTLAVRSSVERSQFGENSEALFLTSGYVQPTAETSARRFSGDEEGFTYGRYGNPTVASFEKRLADLEGAEACISTASGMSAILMMCLGLLKSGDHIVCSQSMFGSTIKLIGTDLAKFGVESTFVPQADTDAWRNAVKPNSKLLFAETPTNPLTTLCDIQQLASLARDAGALLCVDNCFATPVLQRPLSLGADIVMHSGTKYLDGQGRVMAGALCTKEEIIRNSLTPTLKSSGMTLAPFNAWVVLKGLETLDIRMTAQASRALSLAKWLEEHPAVKRVYYPGLSSHPQHELAMAQQNGSGGAILSFEVRAECATQARARAFYVLDMLTTLSLCTNLGDTKTLLSHPASTSHGRLTEEQRQMAGITQGLIRVSVGLEYLEDIKEDISRGLDSFT